MEKITVYTEGTFGNIIKTEGRLVDAGYSAYAQYESLPYVVYVPKRKRKARGVRPDGFNPFMIVLKGWDHPEPDGLFGSAESNDDAVVQRGMYSSCDPRWREDFLRNVNINKEDAVIYEMS